MSRSIETILFHEFVLEHPNPDRYTGHRILVVRPHGYVHLVPYEASDDHLFLKTIIPSRRAQGQCANVRFPGEHDA